MARKTEPGSLTLLGRSKAKPPSSPAQARLETFPNPARRQYRIHFETDDFTSLCPVTGQADFARIEIDYVPDRLCVESKALKFYFASYRGERAFNEAATNGSLYDPYAGRFRRSLPPAGRDRNRAIFGARGNRA